MTRAVLALGANLGDRLATLRAALADLDADGVTVVAVSHVYESAPVGGPEQPAYLNAVVSVDTTLPPRALLRRCHEIEARHGRERLERWGPRTLDIDLIVHGTESSCDDDLTLPHPRAAERAFVLRPWLDIEPDAAFPGGVRVASLLAPLGESGITRYAELDAAPENAS